MDNNEKLLLLDLLLQDIRGNWGWEKGDRTKLALKLAGELGLKVHVKRIIDYNTALMDGRWFRTSFEHGGYEGMSEVHGLDYTYHDKSDEFKNLCDDYLTHPSQRFDDLY